jgi:hypothetical protein
MLETLFSEIFGKQLEFCLANYRMFRSIFVIHKSQLHTRVYFYVWNRCECFPMWIITYNYVSFKLHHGTYIHTKASCFSFETGVDVIITIFILKLCIESKTPIFSAEFFGENLLKNHDIGPRGRCYDHNFLRFLPIFCEKIGVFRKNQCYDQNF